MKNSVRVVHERIGEKLDRSELLKELEKFILKRFERDLRNNPNRALWNWYFSADINLQTLEREISATISRSVDNYYSFVSKHDQKNEIRRMNGISNRLNRLTELLSKTEEKYSELDKITIMICEGLKVSESEKFVDQLVELLIYIKYNPLDIPLDIRLIKTSLSISGIIFALEYARRKHQNKRTWDRVAASFIEFYNELGYGGVVDAIEYVMFRDNYELNRIYDALKCEDDKFNKFRGILGNDLRGYIYTIESRFKSKLSLLRKLQRQKVNLADVERAREVINDMNGIRVVLKDSSMLEDALKRMFESLATNFKDANPKIIEVEAHNIDVPRSIINHPVKFKKDERDYRAIHILVQDQETKRKIEIQIVENPQQYRKHLYDIFVSHLSYKKPEMVEDIISHLSDIYHIISELDMKLSYKDTELILPGHTIKVSNRKIVCRYGNKKLILELNRSIEPFLKVFGTRSQQPIEFYADEWSETNTKIVARV